MKACHDLPFIAKNYTKSQSNEVKRTFNCDFAMLSKKRSACPCCNDLVWKSQFNEMKRTFSCHFGLFKEKASRPLLLTYFESRNSMKWKGLLTLIFPLLSHFFLKVAIQWKWKTLSTVILSCFHSPSQPGPFGHLFWKSQFNENEKDFQL